MPRFTPTDEQRKNVEAMSGYGIPHEDIARLIISPRTKEAIDAKTLRSAFRVELDTGHIKANSAVAQSLYQQATGGHVTAAIWWTKTRMGWKETIQHDGTIDVGLRVNNAARERLGAKINALAGRTAGDTDTD